MVMDCSFGVTVRSLPTVREESGLALSSRNRRLSDAEKKEAASLYKTLCLCKDGLTSGKRFSDLRPSIEDYLSNFAAVNLEYLELVRLRGFEITDTYDPSEEHAVLIAAFVDGVRLIDNIVF
jgi:pantoate--beta-alanine ligase